MYSAIWLPQTIPMQLYPLPSPSLDPAELGTFSRNVTSCSAATSPLHLCVHMCAMHLREDVPEAVYEYRKGNNGEGKKELKIRTGCYMPWTDKSEIYQW